MTNPDPPNFYGLLADALRGAVAALRARRRALDAATSVAEMLLDATERHRRELTDPSPAEGKSP